MDSPVIDTLLCQRMSTYRKMYWLIMTVMFIAPTVQAFHLSMVASRSPHTDIFRNPARSTSNPFPNPFGFFPSPPPLPGLGSISSSGVSSAIISQLAVLAIKRRLADQVDVSCDVAIPSADMILRGRVGPVTVRGRDWRSELGLTCRAIEACVDGCDIDIGRVMSHQKLSLLTPAKGRAMIALDSVDFGNFITHPLMRRPAVTGHDDFRHQQQSATTEARRIQFRKEGTQIDPTTKAVTFFANYHGHLWQCILNRGSSDQARAVVHVSVAQQCDPIPNLDVLAHQMTGALSRFFNEMVFELDGVYLSFRDMMVTDRGASPTLMLALNIVVRKLPSRGAAF